MSGWGNCSMTYRKKKKKEKVAVDKGRGGIKRDNEERSREITRRS